MIASAVIGNPGRSAGRRASSAVPVARGRRRQPPSGPAGRSPHGSSPVPRPPAKIPAGHQRGNTHSGGPSTTGSAPCRRRRPDCPPIAPPPRHRPQHHPKLLDAATAPQRTDRELPRQVAHAGTLLATREASLRGSPSSTGRTSPSAQVLEERHERAPSDVTAGHPRNEISRCGTLWHGSVEGHLR